MMMIMMYSELTVREQARTGGPAGPGGTGGTGDRPLIRWKISSRTAAPTMAVAR